MPLFQQLSHMYGVLHVQSPPTLQIVSALMRQGYCVSRSHTDLGAFKTDAPDRAQWTCCAAGPRRTGPSAPRVLPRRPPPT